MVYIFFANGFEEIEAFTTIDVLRRCGVEVLSISITGNRIITGAHGIAYRVDTFLRSIELKQSDVIVLPGGMPAAATLLSSERLKRLLLEQHNRHGLIAAICAAPMILGEHGILANHKATCYPGFEEHLKNAAYTAAQLEVDNHIITANGPGAALPFAFAIAGKMVRQSVIKKVKQDMMLSENVPAAPFLPVNHG